MDVKQAAYRHAVEQRPHLHANGMVAQLENESHRVVGMGDRSLRDRLSDVPLVDVEGADHLEVSRPVACQIEVHQAARSLALTDVGCPVIFDTLTKARRAVATPIMPRRLFFMATS
jgi:hypothetical protein